MVKISQIKHLEHTDF